MADENKILDYVKDKASDPVTWIGAGIGAVGLYFLGGAEGGLLRGLLGLLLGGGAVVAIGEAVGAVKENSESGINPTQLPKEIVRVDINSRSQEIPVTPGKLMELHFHRIIDNNIADPKYVRRNPDGTLAEFPEQKPIIKVDTVFHGYVDSKNRFVITDSAQYRDSKKTEENIFPQEKTPRIAIEDGKITKSVIHSSGGVAFQDPTFIPISQIAVKAGSDIYEFGLSKKGKDNLHVLGRLAADKKTLQVFQIDQVEGVGFFPGMVSYFIDPPFPANVTRDKEGVYNITGDKENEKLFDMWDRKKNPGRVKLSADVLLLGNGSLKIFDEKGENSGPVRPTLKGEMDKNGEIFHVKEIESIKINVDIPLDNGHLIPESIPAIRKAIDEAKQKAKEQGIDLSFSTPQQNLLQAAKTQFDLTKNTPLASANPNAALPLVADKRALNSKGLS